MRGCRQCDECYERASAYASRTAARVFCPDRGDPLPGRDPAHPARHHRRVSGPNLPRDKTGKIPEMTGVRGEQVTGGSFPPTIWKKFMTEAVKRSKVKDFAAPSLGGEVILPSPSPTPCAPGPSPDSDTSNSPSGSPSPQPSPTPTFSSLPSPETEVLATLPPLPKEKAAPARSSLGRHFGHGRGPCRRLSIEAAVHRQSLGGQLSVYPSLLQ